MGEIKKFFKVGDSVVFKSNTDGLDYDLEPGKVYTIIVSRYSEDTSFKICPSLQLPNKVYTTNQDNKFINKVINSYNILEKGTLGVMLSGLKGSGKTVLAKVLATKSNLPIIVIDQYIHPKILNNTLKKLGDTEVCVLFDEVDKNGEDYDSNYLLSVLDGVDSTGKKLMVFTANDPDEISEYMKDRCSRIRYWKEFNEIPASLISAVLEDKLDNKKEVKTLTDFIQENFSCISFDNVLSFVNEVNANPKDTFEELFEDMNLSKR